MQAVFGFGYLVASQPKNAFATVRAALFVGGRKLRQAAQEVRELLGVFPERTEREERGSLAAAIRTLFERDRVPRRREDLFPR